MRTVIDRLSVPPDVLGAVCLICGCWLVKSKSVSHGFDCEAAVGDRESGGHVQDALRADRVEEPADLNWPPGRRAAYERAPMRPGDGVPDRDAVTADDEVLVPAVADRPSQIVFVVRGRCGALAQ